MVNLLTGVQQFFGFGEVKQQQPDTPRATPEKKSDPAYGQYRTSVRMLGNDQPVYSPRNYQAFARDGYIRCIVAHRCIDIVATNMSGIPWHLYSGRGKRRKEIEEHPLLDLLYKPNPGQSGSDLVATMAAYYKLAGNAYMWANRLKRGTPQELWILRPDRMSIIPGGDGPTQYVYKINNVTTKYDAADILHWKRFHPLDDLYGLSEMEVGHSQVGQLLAGDDRNMALLQNAARPSGGLFAKEVLSDAEFARLNDEIMDNYTGASNSGMPLFFDGDVKWQPMGLTPLELDWLRSRTANNREICIALGVPSVLLGDSESKTYANYETALIALYTETCLPAMDRLRDAYNRFLVPMYSDNLQLDYDRNDIEALQENRDGVSARASHQWEVGGITQNEYRLAIGQDEIDGGDFFLFKVGKELLLIPKDRLKEYVETMAERAINPPEPPAPVVTTVNEAPIDGQAPAPKQLPAKGQSSASDTVDAVKTVVSLALAALERKDQAALAQVARTVESMQLCMDRLDSHAAPTNADVLREETKSERALVVAGNTAHKEFYARFEEE